MSPSNFEQLCIETFREYLEDNITLSDRIDRLKDFINVSGKVSTHVNDWGQNFNDTLEHFQTYTDLDLSDESSRRAIRDIVDAVECSPELYY